MAKTGIWLRGARGKLAGNVLFKGENATIIRENVTPRNPQSAKQMLQRVAFATVAQAAKFMLPVIGQTFQGAGDEKKNRREFFRANVNKLKTAFDRFNGITSGLPAQFPDYTAALPKGVAALIPNRYVMSRGELTLPPMWQPTAKFNALQSEGTIESVATPPYGEISKNYNEVLDPLELLTLMTGLKLGQQLTFSAISTIDGTNVVTVDETYPDLVRYANFISRRLVITNDEDAAAEAAVNISATTTQQDIQNALMALIDKEKSDPIIVKFFEDYVFGHVEISEATQGQTSRTITYGLEEEPHNLVKLMISEQDEEAVVSRTVGFSVILSESRNNTWAYSNSEMAIIPKVGQVNTGNDKYYGFDYANAWKTYVKTTDTTSNLYTRRGGFENNVNA